MRYEFNVPTIGCSQCVPAIRGALTPLDGVYEVTVSVANKTVTVVTGGENAPTLNDLTTVIQNTKNKQGQPHFVESGEDVTNRSECRLL